MTIQLGRLRQVALPCRDLSRSVQFYRESVDLGFLAMFESAGLAFFRLGDTRLLLERAGADRPSGGVPYFEVQDIDAAYAVLVEKGIAFDTAPLRHSVMPSYTGP
jgi:catechol 2,3-dioxygenase-like lactoylglutathione lyase family enzyme